MPAGYSGTSLAKKLGIKEGQKTWRAGMPDSVAVAITKDGIFPTLLQQPVQGIEMAHLFVGKRTDLASQLAEIKPLLVPSGTIWVSWPKKSAGLLTDLSDTIIRVEALPLDLVDVKVCAVDKTWSGLKFVIRRNKRRTLTP